MSVKYIYPTFTSFQASKQHLEKHYADLSSKGFFAGLVTYMASGPVVAMVSSIKKHAIITQSF